MHLRRLSIRRERQRGTQPGGEFYVSDVRSMLPSLLSAHGGAVQLIYIDPPFFSGQDFDMRVRVGERDWKTGVGSLTRVAYQDTWRDLDEYMSLMREVLKAARELLSPSGVIYVHIDFRMHARLRLLMDEIFGERNFLNEIIWAYQTGGRARRYFSRKHDILLFYRKGPDYYFKIEDVPISRQDVRRNHMKRQVDEDGRVYRTIKSGGKIYTYYDDEPAYPGDVWDDVSHLQQKDPQRTGYDTQKPLRLLERIIRSSSRPGDLVMDLFAGSGTTLEAASLCGRRFVGVDQSPFSLLVLRRRMLGAQVEYIAPEQTTEPASLVAPPYPEVEADMTAQVGIYEITLKRFEVEQGLVARRFQDLDAVDNWCAGYVRGDTFVPESHALRTRAQPELKSTLGIPMLEGDPVIRVQDVLGRHYFFQLTEKDERAL